VSVNDFVFFCSPRRHGATWNPDMEYYKQYDMPCLIPQTKANVWKMPPLNHYEAPVEKSVTNINLNFGPQHPAAHGVLRLVLELDGEVKTDCLNLFLCYCFCICKYYFFL
jgi:NADH dehydrogenase (ubiquinone) Fe-S protein 2